MFPTRTARFGVALVTSGSLRLKSKEFHDDLTAVESCCLCSTCRDYSKAMLHVMFKENHPLASQLLTTHNLSYMMRLMRTMREAIMEGSDAFEAYVLTFLKQQYPNSDIPAWVVDALHEAGIEVPPA